MKIVQVKKLSSDTAWLLLAIFAYSYPLAALFGASDGSVAVSAVPTIIALGIAAILGIMQAPSAMSVSVMLISSGIFLLNTAVWYIGGVGDVQKMIVFNGVIFIFGTMLAFSIAVPKILETLDRALMMLGIIALVIFATNVSEYDSGRLTYGDSNPIWLGRLFGIASIGTLYALIRGRVSVAVGAPLLLALFVSMAMTGSRGPVLAFAFVALIALIINPIKYKYTIIFITAMSISFVFLLAKIFSEGDIRGLSFGQADDVSYFIRLDMFEYCKFIIRSYPGGIGVGNFIFMNFTYPHNIIIELLVEWGWCFGGLYLLLFVFGGLGLIKMGRSTHLLLLLFAFDLANACASGDITSPRLLYGLSIMGVAFLLGGGRIPVMGSARIN